MARRDWLETEGNTNSKLHTETMDQTPNFPENLLPLHRVFQKCHEHQEHQSSTKINKWIVIGKVSSCRARIYTRFCLIVPKSLGSSELGFNIQTKSQDISLHNQPFQNLKVSWSSTLSNLQNAYEHVKNEEIRIWGTLQRQCWILSSWCAIPWNRWSLMIEKVNVVLSLARICS